MPSLRTSTKSRRYLLRRVPNDLLPALQTSGRRGRRTLLRRLRSVVEGDAQNGESKTRRRAGEKLARREIRRRVRTVGVYSDGRGRRAVLGLGASREFSRTRKRNRLLALPRRRLGELLLFCGSRFCRSRRRRGVDFLDSGARVGGSATARRRFVRALVGARADSGRRLGGSRGDAVPAGPKRAEPIRFPDATLAKESLSRRGRRRPVRRAPY